MKSSFNELNSNNRRTERNDWRLNKCLRCVSKDNFITNFLKLDTLENDFHWNTDNPNIVHTDRKK